MPLRDHFRPPVWNQASWEGFHAAWPAVMVQQLSRILPPEFFAEPHIDLGSYFVIDSAPDTTSTYMLPEPTLTLETDPGEQYEYEVLIYDQSGGRTLVAAVEIVSPANKDRPENRRALVAKCAALLQKHVCVSLVDLVTIRQFNLYTDLLDLLGYKDPTFGPTPPIYAVTCRGRRVEERPRFEVWAYPLEVGRPLPALPICLDEERAVSLDLETSYEETCRALRIR